MKGHILTAQFICFFVFGFFTHFIIIELRKENKLKEENKKPQNNKSNNKNDTLVIRDTVFIKSIE